MMPSSIQRNTPLEPLNAIGKGRAQQWEES